jgi:hypothetical protein
MNRRLGALVTVTVLAAACDGGSNDDVASNTPAASGALDTVAGTGRPEPPMLGAHAVRGASPFGGTSAVMTWHSGAVLTNAAVTAIFWGASWSDPTFTGDKITGIDSFYQGYGGSHYASASAEYTGTNGQVGTAVAYGGNLIDTSAAPSRAPKVSAIGDEVCKMIKSPVANGYYPVYTSTPRGSASYCAWHSYGACNGVPVQIAFFFKLDGDSGCDPQDTAGSHSQGLAALANVSAHELSEAMTDPRNGGWYDSSGAENGDKCAWTFNVPFVTLANGTSWKVQGEWSNAAYRAGTGYPNRNGQSGCLSGI